MCKCSNAGNSNMPKRIHNTFSLSEDVKAFDLIRKEKNYMLKLIRSKNKSSLHELVKKKREVLASFAVASQNAKVMAMVHAKCFVKMEKALHLSNRAF